VPPRLSKFCSPPSAQMAFRRVEMLRNHLQRAPASLLANIAAPWTVVPTASLRFPGSALFSSTEVRSHVSITWG
jgi:hypothetical protein